MKNLALIALLLLALAGCKILDLNATMPDNNGQNGSCHLAFKGVGKVDISGLNASVCGGSLGVDKITADTPTGVNELAACLLAPQLCKLPP